MTVSGMEQCIIKDKEQLAGIREAALIAEGAIEHVRPMIQSGARASFIDREISEYLTQKGGEAANLEVDGYGCSSSISLYSEFAHAKPHSSKIIQGKDIVSVDVGVKYNGLYADAAKSFAVGDLSEREHKLIETCKRALHSSIKVLNSGGFLSDYGREVCALVEAAGFKAAKQLVGHGVGLAYHEPPKVFNFYNRANDIILKEGMSFAFELMICFPCSKLYCDSSSGVYRTDDGGPAVHFEKTVIIGEGGAEITGL